ncbi:heavy-metal-associated domain-containing protein [Cupriavidus respiraculi]|uniref:heavy-metal-associated domain-containing protein n=1 Tax=Cupriavidus respiraculi TaxID=195930 RepID=UPI001C946C5C|nr:heavy-metal-associated domain-containing protein [Cupriavidus respiraculi]MBY4946509.1 heavy-metal-associated domain-containing protein [Cupriavidus respiraculi]
MMQFQVEGMSCNHCVGAITRAVQALDPGASVNADIAAQQVRVQTSAGEQAVRHAIEAAGYPVAA